MSLARISHSTTSRSTLVHKLFTVSLLATAMGFAQQAMAAPSVERSVKVDESVYEIAFNATTQNVYAAVTGERVAEGESAKNKVTAGIVVLDAKTLEQVNKIATGETRPFGLAINNQRAIEDGAINPIMKIIIYITRMFK